MSASIPVEECWVIDGVKKREREFPNRSAVLSVYPEGSRTVADQLERLVQQIV